MPNECETCKANKVCDHNEYGFENCGNYIPADVVKVVRCKDCVSCPDIKTLTKGCVWCRKFRAEVYPLDYCSYGERRAEK